MMLPSLETVIYKFIKALLSPDVCHDRIHFRTSHAIFMLMFCHENHNMLTQTEQNSQKCFNNLPIF